MLPFFPARKAAMVIIAQRGKRGVEAQPEAGESSLPKGLEEAAADLLRALDERSISGIAGALSAAYELCEGYENPEPEKKEDDES